MISKLYQLRCSKNFAAYKTLRLVPLMSDHTHMKIPREGRFATSFRKGSSNRIIQSFLLFPPRFINDGSLEVLVIAIATLKLDPQSILSCRKRCDNSHDDLAKACTFHDLTNCVHVVIDGTRYESQILQYLSCVPCTHRLSYMYVRKSSVTFFCHLEPSFRYMSCMLFTTSLKSPPFITCCLKFLGYGDFGDTRLF